MTLKIQILSALLFKVIPLLIFLNLISCFKFSKRQAKMKVKFLSTSPKTFISKKNQSWNRIFKSIRFTLEEIWLSRLLWPNCLILSEKASLKRKLPRKYQWIWEGRLLRLRFRISSKFRLKDLWKQFKKSWKTITLLRPRKFSSPYLRMKSENTSQVKLLPNNSKLFTSTAWEFQKHPTWLM